MVDASENSAPLAPPGPPGGLSVKLMLVMVTGPVVTGSPLIARAAAVGALLLPTVEVPRSKMPEWSQSIHGSKVSIEVWTTWLISPLEPVIVKRVPHPI